MEEEEGEEEKVTVDDSKACSAGVEKSGMVTVILVEGDAM